MSPLARRCIPFFLALLAATPLAAAPARVASMHLCSDQLLLALAAPEQIVSLSYLAADPQYSPIAAAAAGFALNHGQAEEILPLAPDMVLTGAFSTTLAANLLERQGLQVVRLDVATTAQQQYAQILAVGALLGAEGTAAGIVQRMQQDIAHAIDALRPQLQGKRAVFYSSNGYSYGAGTLQHEFISSLGMHNAAAHLQGPALLPLEQLVVAAPDFVIINQPTAADPPLAHALLQHPALAAQDARYRFIVLPDTLFQCASPQYSSAYAAFEAQL